MGEVVRRGGFGTSVTPVSQFYFQQAYNNVMFGAWKKIAEGYGKMVLGYFGKTPIAPDKEIMDIAAQQLKLQPTTEKTVDIDDRDPKKGVAWAKTMLAEAGIKDVTDENIFIVAACKDKGIAFLKGEAKTGVRKGAAAKDQSVAPPASRGPVTVTIEGKPYAVRLEKDAATVNGVPYTYSVKEGIDESPSVPAISSKSVCAVNSPLPGNILRVTVALNQSVKEGETIVVIEAMKMETEIRAPQAGVIKSISVAQGNQVTTGQELAQIQ
jgi:pyruvate carboxylase subunit B